MNHRWLAVLWFTSWLAWPLELRAERLPLKPYTTADGLAHNNILRIVRDSGGFLWFCTAGGLARFDGYSFANFSVDRGLPHSVVNDLLETRDGRYWVATERGLVRLDPRGRPLFSTVVAHDAGDFALAVKVLREGADGTIWAGTDRGLFRLDGADGRVSLRAVDIQLPREYPEQRVIADVLEDAEGSLWIAAPSGLYRRRPDGRSDRYTRADGLPSDFLQDLLEDRAGRLWIGTRLGGFFRFRLARRGAAPLIDQAFTYLPEDEYGLQTSWVFQLFETSDRRLLLATARGLVEFSTDAARPQRFRNYTARNGLSDHNITAIAEDSGGNVWLGTSTAGAMKLTRSGFTSYNDLDGIAVGECDLRRSRRARLLPRYMIRRPFQRLRACQKGSQSRAGSPDQAAAWMSGRSAGQLVQAVGGQRSRLGHRAGHAPEPQWRLVGRHRGGALPLPAVRRFRTARNRATGSRLYGEGRPGRPADLPAVRRLQREHLDLDDVADRKRAGAVGTREPAHHQSGGPAGPRRSRGRPAGAILRRGRGREHLDRF